jgi:DHA1 family tetracycline resistance protein-like MFS transporter
VTSARPADSSRSATLALFFTVFIDLIGFGIVLPLLPSYAARLQVGDAGIGFVVASFSLMQFLLAPWWGKLSDRVGRRPVILVGLAGSACSYLLFAYAGSFWILLLSRIIAGGMGATVNVAQAYLADVTPPERRAKAMGLIGAAFGLGFVVGPAIGGLTSRWGEAAPGLVAAGLSTTNFLLAWFRLPETRVHRPKESAPSRAMHWRLLVAPYAVLLLSTIAFTVMYVVFPLYVERTLGYDRHQTAYLFVLLGFVTAVVQGGLVGRLVQRFGERRLMEAGCLLVAIGLALLPWTTGGGQAHHLQALMAVMLVLGLGTGVISPSTTGYISRIAPPSEQGRSLGLLTSVSAIARIVGPVLAGGLNQLLGSPATFVTMACLALAGGLAGFAARRTDAPREIVP